MPNRLSRRPLAVASLSLLVAACSPAASTPSASVSPIAAATESAATDTIDSVADAALQIQGGPDFPAEGFGSLWLLAPDSNDPALVRVDPEANEVVATIALPGRLCQGFAVTDDAVWACTPEGAARINPQTNEIADEVTYASGKAIGRLAVGAGSIWSLGGSEFWPNTLVRIDPDAGTATTIPLGHQAATLAYAFDAVWVTAPTDGLMLRVEPADGAITEHTTGLEGPWALAVGPDSLWVTLHGTFGGEPPPRVPDQPTVVRIDPADGSVIAEIATGAASGSYGGIWAEDDAVWVRAPDQFLTRIDPASNEVARTISGPGSAGDVTVAYGSLWATAVEYNIAYRLAP